MIELFAELCLAERPEVCVERLLPGPAPCIEARPRPGPRPAPGWS